MVVGTSCSVTMLAQWLRAAGQNPDARRVCEASSSPSRLALGWVACVPRPCGLGRPRVRRRADPRRLAGPFVADTSAAGSVAPAHSPALLAALILTLGEGLSAPRRPQGPLAGTLAPDVALLGLAATAHDLRVWWTYFVVLAATSCRSYRNRFFGWATGLPCSARSSASAPPARGGVLPRAPFRARPTNRADRGGAADGAVPSASTAVAALTRSRDPFHLLRVALTLVVVAAALPVRPSARADPSLLVLPSPRVTVVGYERSGTATTPMSWPRCPAVRASQPRSAPCPWVIATVRPSTRARTGRTGRVRRWPQAGSTPGPVADPWQRSRRPAGHQLCERRGRRGRGVDRGRVKYHGDGVGESPRAAAPLEQSPLSILAGRTGRRRRPLEASRRSSCSATQVRQPPDGVRVGEVDRERSTPARQRPRARHRQRRRS